MLRYSLSLSSTSSVAAEFCWWWKSAFTWEVVEVEVVVGVVVSLSKHMGDGKVKLG